MNTRNNQRYQDTEEKIIAAFIGLLQEKELDKITVAEICRLCGVNRTSFYLHFTDVFDMMDKIEQRLAVYCGELFSEPSEGYDIGGRFLRLFAFMREHRGFYRVYLSRNRDISVFDAVLSRSAEASLRRLAAQLGFAGERELHYHQVFFKAGFAALSREWLLRDCPESPEEIAAILAREYTPNLDMF